MTLKRSSMTRARTTTLVHRLLTGAAMTVLATAIGAAAPQDKKAAAPAMSGSGDAALVKKTADGMVGHWLSTEGETRPNGQGGQNYLKRDFTNTPALAKAALIFFKDGAYKDKTFTLVASGPYKFVKPSAAVAGAIETDFSFSDIRITPHNADMVGMLNSGKTGSCGPAPWKLDVEQSLKATDGCAVFGIKLSTYKEFDLVKVEGDKLYYGARPADGSVPDTTAKRATSLQVPLVRAK